MESKNQDTTVTEESTNPNSLISSPVKQVSKFTTKRDLTGLEIEDPVMMHVKTHTLRDNKHSQTLLK